ncbi:LRR receptor-like serine/threonine-protein kinase EFR [Magnolia sinica]|uniref:LRR receptor-like serine/threonine-protein kinase EFR n=1 Tax=Magnolia sinica TaxID=86752 RepID=UPI0026581C4A|nr:LRR receptor-like serine/threonine-protein kinase EFR [Magnolia sinica]
MDPKTKTITTPYLLLTLLFCLLHPSTASNTTTDQLSLLQFKSSITTDPERILDSWTTNTTFCNWTGITCGSADQRVIALTLPNLRLSGTLSPHIANLSFLRTLNLQKNTFQGPLPREFGNLFQLQDLLLAWNRLNGRIPSSLSSCSKLQQLDLSDNEFEGLIPSELSSLAELQILILAKNQLTGHIPSSFGNLSSLNNLILQRNQLNGSIPAELGRLQKLVNIQFSSNNLTGEIPSSIFNISSLTHFQVTNNQLMGSLPSDLFFKLPDLIILYVAMNQMTGLIPSSLSNASTLEEADFSKNSFSGRIPMLGNLLSIVALNFEFNQLVSDGPDGLDFITSLSNSRHLAVFSVGMNRLTGHLPSSIANLSRTLVMLEMEYNQIEGTLPAEIGNLANLTMLSVRYNSLSGRIPSTIGNLQNLQKLSLQGNSFNGSIPESLGNLSVLSELSLNGNHLTGTNPETLANCRRLQSLDLSANGLEGTIPDEIFGIPNLALLFNLSHNSLSGPLPAEIGKLQMVQSIDVSENQLSGEIPASIGDCRSLVNLGMAGNSFQGPIPSQVGNLRGLEIIDLSSNNLSGSIPTSLESLQFLHSLNLSLNNLQGEVPEGGVFTNSTAISLDRNPNLCGGGATLGLPNCSGTRNKRSSLKVKLIIGVVVGVSAFCFLCIVFLLLSRKRKSVTTPTADVVSFDGPLTMYTYYDLRAATDNFSEKNLIGEGSFGSVYRGVLRNGTMVAIKVFKMDQRDASKSFIAECESMRNIRHRNLVRIISACSSSVFKALVLPFMPNGSLESWLHETDDELQGRERRWLDLRQRLEIAVGIADAMEYLHHDCEIPVVHCDLKPSNVLLDKDMNAHVGDFGLAKLILQNTSNHQLTSTMELKGSIGYIPPEYGLRGGVSTRGDVYSYGILLLELFTRKKSTDEMFGGDLTLRKWVVMALPDRVVDIVDSDLIEKEQIWVDCLISVMRLGLDCSVDSPEERPTMRNVSLMIKAAREMLK